jgi:hypothetical protein
VKFSQPFMVIKPVEYTYGDDSPECDGKILGTYSMTTYGIRQQIEAGSA